MELLLALGPSMAVCPICSVGCCLSSEGEDSVNLRTVVETTLCFQNLFSSITTAYQAQDYVLYPIL